MSVIINIKVTPSSGKQEFTLNKSNEIKCFLKKPPKKGLANAELIKLISKKLKIPQNYISIISGLTSRKKKIKIDLDITKSKCIEMLGLSNQKDIFEQI